MWACPANYSPTTAREGRGWLILSPWQQRQEHSRAGATTLQLLQDGRKPSSSPSPGTWLPQEEESYVEIRRKKERNWAHTRQKQNTNKYCLGGKLINASWSRLRRLEMSNEKPKISNFNDFYWLKDQNCPGSVLQLQSVPFAGALLKVWQLSNRSTWVLRSCLFAGYSTCPVSLFLWKSLMLHLCKREKNGNGANQANTLEWK